MRSCPTPYFCDEQKLCNILLSLNLDTSNDCPSMEGHERENIIECKFISAFLYMAFQKGTQTAPQGEIMPPQAGISTAGNGNSGCAGRRLTVAGHGGIMNPLLLMYKTGQRWRAT